jgi:hypothetical protein
MNADAGALPYCWLSSPMLARNELLGPVLGLPLPYLVRHGAIAYTGASGTYPHSQGAIAQCIREGRMRVYLSAVDAGGVPIAMHKALYIPDILLADVLVMGPHLFETFQASCNLNDCEVIRLDRSCVSAHEWSYVIPDHRESDSLYRQLSHALEYDELPGDGDIVRMLCERYTCKRDIPEMRAILPPYIGPPNRGKAYWRNDAIEIAIERQASICTRRGDLPLSKEYFKTGPVVQFEGFLLPPGVARLLEVDDRQHKKWAVTTSLKDITLRLPASVRCQ